MRGRCPPGWPLAVRRLGGGEGDGGEGGGLPAVPLWSPVLLSGGCGGGGLTVSAPGGQPSTGGGRTPLPFPFRPSGVLLSCRPSPSGPPLLSLLPPRQLAPAGVVVVRVSGHWSAVCGSLGSLCCVCPCARGSCPLPYQGWRARSHSGRVGGSALGRGARACQVAAPRRRSSPTPLCLPPGTIAARRSCHLRRRLCGGSGCSGGGFLRRYCQWVSAMRRARGTQLLASASVTRSTAPYCKKAAHIGSLSGHPA